MHNNNSIIFDVLPTLYKNSSFNYIHFLTFVNMKV